MSLALSGWVLADTDMREPGGHVKEASGLA